MSGESTPLPTIELEEQDPAIIVYTSGSTGNPKGVVNSHGTLMLAMKETVSVRTQEDKFLSIASFSFIAIVLDIFTPLFLGATVCIADDTERKDADLLVEMIHTHRITTAFFPPQLGKSILPRAEDQLVSIITGSDRVANFYSKKTKIVNAYGASETCGPCLFYEIDQPYAMRTPICPTIEGRGVYLLDDNHEQVPLGEEGEICISGQIATEYLNLPELTQERFIVNPFATGTEGKILFKTGDMGRINEKNQLEYVQRKDWMVKIRGFRVEPGEVEVAIVSNTPAKEAVVKSFTNGAGELALFGIYTAESTISSSEIVDGISRFLPNYMIPVFLEQVERLPLNANGKVDYKNILPPDLAKFKSVYAPPTNQIEKDICNAFAAVFHTDSIGIYDDFHLLGGDSITAVRLQTMLEQYHLSAGDILSAGTPEQLAMKQTRPILGKAENRQVWPLTFAEEQMAIEQQLEPESVSYNINLAIRIEGTLHKEQLEVALQHMLKRHRILCSYYPLVNGEYSHCIQEDLQVAIESISCKKEEESQLIQAHNTPFQLEVAPLLRMYLYEHETNCYTLQFCIHHIIFDKSSCDVFIPELLALYHGESLPPLSYDYFDYAVWQEDKHEGEQMGAAAFQEMFVDGVPENEMPTHVNRPNKLPLADVRLVEHLKSSLIKETAKKLGVTSYGLLTSVLGMTLGKYCGSEDVVIGSAMSGRGISEQDSMIGMFVNILPIRMKPQGTKNISEYVLETANGIRTVKTNQTYPFAKLVPILAPDRNASRSPVFDVIFNYLQEFPVVADGDMEWSMLPMPRQNIAIDLLLEAEHEGDEIALTLSYSKDLYDAQVVENFMEQYLTILHRIIEGTGTEMIMDVAELPERQRLVVMEEFTGLSSDALLGNSVVDLIQEQVKLHPNNRAVVFKDQSLTYEEFNGYTNRIASFLMEKGVGSGDVVGIMVRKGLLMPALAVAASKTGAAYLPMDPSYPTDRLEFMVEDAGVKVLITEEDLLSQIPSFQGHVLTLSMIGTLPVVDIVINNTKPSDTFILLYTSGTTGKPKGVMLSHGNLVNFIHYYNRMYELTDTDNIPAYASFGFDANMMDTYPTLTSGACLHILPEEMRLDLKGIANYYEKENITVAFLTTQIGRQFVETYPNAKIRAMSVGGEGLTPVMPPNYSFYNAYGPTECTIFCTHFKIEELYDRVPIGWATDNTQIYVVDGRGRLAPVGVAGELCIAGRQVAKGYLNHPDLTEEKFVANPFSQEEDYNRIYKSGDVVRYLPHGIIDFVGRRDFQVKIRGFRVELTEIEGRIRQFPNMKDATVIAREDSGGGKKIVAYLVSDESIDISALEDFIKEELPVYMVPSAMMQIDTIPWNQNGKVNRKELPEIPLQAEEIVPPNTDLERQLITIIGQVLGSEEFGITTDLMYAGLNSLSAIKAAALVSEATGKELSTMEIMNLKTVEEIAKLLTEKSQVAEEEVYEKRDYYPLTTNQLGVYFSCVKDSNSVVYNIPFELTFSLATDCKKLQEAVELVINNHAYVKSQLLLVDNTPVLAPLYDTDVIIPYRECSHATYEQKREQFVKPFSLYGDVLYRMAMYRTEEGIYLLLDFHHMIFDGASLDILLRDMMQVYNGENIGQEAFTSYDLALQEQALESSDALVQAKEFFAKRIGDCEGATNLPYDHHSTEIGSPITATCAVPKGIVAAAIKGLGITPSNLFLGATAIVTGRIASTHQVRIATISNGRDGSKLQNNLGMLVKTLPVALSLEEGPKSCDFLQGVQEEMIGILSNQIYPYLYASSDYEYNASLLYAYQGGVVSDYQLEKEPIQVSDLGRDHVKFPLSIHIYESATEYIVEAEGDDSLFCLDTVTMYADCIGQVAQQLTMAQEQSIHKLSIMTKEQEEVVESFRHPYEPIRETALHHMFETIAENHPDNEALVATDGTYTYGTLNQRANAVANALLAMGVASEEPVGFLLPRTSHIITSMLGIMKAGCAYIPIDPDYPEERIAHVLEDSGARYLITDGSTDLKNVLDIHELLSHENTANPQIKVTRDQLCYIIYTSGSTGKPKGVMLTHGGILNYVANVPQNRHVTALVERACVMVSVTTVSFDMFLKEAFTTLMNGLKLVLADDEASKNPEQLAQLFRETGGSAFNATPSRMMQYMELPSIVEMLSKCHVIMAGGEGYPAALYQKLRSITDATLINTYGPTEITVSSNAKILEDDQITIGAPLHNVTEQVMDFTGNPLPVGATGELWIGGYGVARGYLGNPEMTAERFVPVDGERYYQSGDLAKWSKSGEITILGRNDGQIKLRGLRIELGEIESALAKIEHISSCVVMVRTIHEVEHLCAYYTADCSLLAETLREELLKTLTVYMVPTAYLQMDALPMTPNGKIDRKQLPEPSLMQKQNYEQPLNLEEEAMCHIFATILHLDKVGATDNFFHLGGSSLLVTQLTIDGAKQGFSINYGDVFAHPTPRELAQLQKESTKDNQEVEDTCITDYDYSRIEKLLENNTIAYLITGDSMELGNIVLTGATGFLGIHMLREYLQQEKGTAYCIIRGGKLSAEERLNTMLAYYFTEDYNDLFGVRIVVVEGSITDEHLYEQLHALPVDTFINCAANVKHFSAGTDIEDVNVLGVEHCVNFCVEKECKFIQVSTASIAGMSIDNLELEQMKLSETMLYFGQDLSNKYVHSKFLAERYILEAIGTKGLTAKIMRVGNLMARDDDGEFQINYNTNNFLSRIKAYHTIGAIPYDDLLIPVEFAPIDRTVCAILQLAKTPKENCVFHPYNDHDIFIGDIMYALEHIGIHITPCERCVYDKAYQSAMQNPNKAKHLNAMVAYQEHGKRVIPIKSVNRYTAQALVRHGFIWPSTDLTYLEKFFEGMKTLGYFD
ncbi:MAG: amino acid adenylation domain-containing protein [Eubacteriales bacterium]